MEDTADLRIVLLGKTGAGKSSTGNTILRDDVFKTSFEANSETFKCEAVTKTIDGRNITVVDTPGYFSTENSDKNLEAEITKCIIECSPGPHAFVIVLNVEKQTPEEKKVVEEILKTFGEEALKYAVVLFTRGDQLEDGKTIRQFVDNNNHLKTLVEKCGDRLHVIDNKYWNNPSAGHGDDRNNALQIKNLLNTIDQMVKQNGGEHYTNEVLQAVEKAIKEEEAKGKPREEAKQSVLKRILINTAGIGTGILLGALLGVPLALASLLAIIVKIFVSGNALAIGAIVETTTGAAAILSTTGIAFGAIAGLGVSAGMVVGGVIGEEAAEEAETAREAAEGAACAVRDIAVDCVRKLSKKNKAYTKMSQFSEN